LSSEAISESIKFTQEMLHVLSLTSHNTVGVTGATIDRVPVAAGIEREPLCRHNGDASDRVDIRELGGLLGGALGRLTGGGMEGSVFGGKILRRTLRLAGLSHLYSPL
jgi:hypothetical protein